MFTRIVAMKRRPDLSVDDFRRHWRMVHGPLMARVPGVHYQQNHVIDTRQTTNHARGSIEVDGFAQWGFAPDDAMREATGHPGLVAAGKDLPNFVGALTRMTCEVRSVVPEPTTGTAVKRMSVLQARPGMTEERFRRYWVDEHATMIAAYPGLLGCRQNIVTGRLAISDPRLADAGVEAAGILEMWYASIEAMEESLASPQAQLAMKHGGEFLSAVTTYVVEECRIEPQPIEVATLARAR